MPKLVAIGKKPEDTWEQAIPSRPVLLGRQQGDGLSDWAVPWDQLISRRHARLNWEGEQLAVERLAEGRNPIFFQGMAIAPSARFLVTPGEQFHIGDTTFQLNPDAQSPDLPIPLAEVELGPAELDRVGFTDANERIAVLSSLPAIIRDAPSDADLEAQVIQVLLAGIPEAHTVGIVCHASGPTPEIVVRAWKPRSSDGPALKPSARLVQKAVRQKLVSVLAMWEPGDLTVEFTAAAGTDWAFCVPLRDDVADGWSLYVAGRNQVEVKDIGAADVMSIVTSERQGDVKFAGLVAEIFVALRQLLDLQRRDARLSMLLSEPIRAAMARHDPDEVLRRREADATIIFCDLRESCRIASQGKDDLFAMWDRISGALDVMTASIVDQGGVVGDFQGDAVMGFWGWPLDDHDRAARAARAALNLQKKFLKAVQPDARDGTGVRCGIGIASGRVIAGRLGTYDQAKISVYGPRVNLASRLEALTKLFRVDILIDDATADLLANNAELSWFRRRRLPRIRPYGMTESVEVSQLLPPAAPGILSDGDRRRFETALDAFTTGDWADSREMLEPLRRDGPSRVLLEFMDEHQNSPPPGWDGVLVMKSK